MKAAGILDFGTALHNPDFAKIAEGAGVLGLSAKSADDISPMLERALSFNGPALVEIPVPKQELSMPPTITYEQAKGSACSCSEPSSTAAPTRFSISPS